MLSEITIIHLNLILNLYRKFNLTLKIKIMKNSVLESVFFAAVILLTTVTIVAYYTIIKDLFSTF